MKCIRAAYHIRGTSEYFAAAHAKLNGKYKKAYEEVKAKRDTIPRGTSFTVRFDPHDGRGEKAVICLNLDAEQLQEVDAREIRRAKRAPPILNRNIQDGPASIYTIRTRSRRVNNGQALV